MAQEGRRPALGLLRSIATALFVIALPLLLITTNVRVAANQPRVYDYSVERYDAASLAGIPEPELKRANRELTRYFNDDDQRTVRIVVRDDRGREVPLFTPRETAHLADVKSLFQKVFSVQQAALAYMLAFIVAVFLWAREAPLRALAAVLARSALLTVGVVAAAAVGALAGFDRLWTQFHFLAFANDFWRLDPNRDHLIQMFPQEFWFDITFLIGLFTVLEALLLGGLAFAYLHLTRSGPIQIKQAGPPPLRQERLARLERLSRQARARHSTH